MDTTNNLQQYHESLQTRRRAAVRNLVLAIIVIGLLLLAWILVSIFLSPTLQPLARKLGLIVLISAVAFGLIQSVEMRVTASLLELITILSQ